MNNTSTVLRVARPVAVALAIGLRAGSAPAAPATGEAVVAAMTGRAQARIFTAPVHEGKTELRDLFEGASVGENVRVSTGRDGRLCLVASPGAIICVAPNSEFEIEQLRHTADGLPRSEDDLIRRIHLRLRRGRILLHAGVPTATLDIRIATEAGTVSAQGGDFVVAEDAAGNWNVATQTYELDVAPRNGATVRLQAGDVVQLAAAGQDPGEIRRATVAENPGLFEFELCNTFFADLEPFIHNATEFDREGLGQYLGLSSSFVAIDAGVIVADASPTIRPTVSGALPVDLPRPGGGEPGGRWEALRIRNWYEGLGAVKGVNYVPRTAVNSVEMWMADTFDAETIDEELGWAHDAGYTAIRVQLQFVVWQADPDGFLDRVDRLLDLAAQHGLRVVPVLFDDLNLAGVAPQAGPQPAPVPGTHNGRWVPGPGAAAVRDRGQWPALEKYVKAVMKKFRNDGRVLYWDLYNTAGNAGLGEESLPLLDQTFNWARSVEAAQPLAVPAWREFGSAMAARKLERSDLVTFHSFDAAEGVEARIQLLERYDRPIICSDWLMRQAGSDFEKLLPVFAAHRVGWFNRGLVAGKTQLQIQQAQYRSEQEPDLWQQNVLEEDGDPYDRREIELIQGFRFLENP